MFVDGTLAQVRKQLDLFNVPSFWIEALDNDDEFRIKGINAAYGEATGMQNDMVTNRLPREVLPETQADAVMHRYRTCRERGQSISYEEVLEMPNGKFLWNTTLVPVISEDGGRCVGVFGSAVVAQVLEQHRQMTEFQEIGYLADEARIKLRNVKSVVELLQSDSCDRDDVLSAAEFIGNVSECIDQALITMRQKSNAARQRREQTNFLMSNTMTNEPSSLSVQEALQALTNLYSGSSDIKNIA